MAKCLSLRLVWAWLALLAFNLKGCSQENCEPHPEGLYTCSSNRFCKDPNVLYTVQQVDLMSCLAECAYRNCSVIQYDCGAGCMLLDECTSEEPSTCGSTIYYVNVQMLTTTTASTTPSLGSCFDGTEPNENYLCSPASHCRNQVSGTYLGLMPLSACLAECDIRWNCRAVQYNCAEQCWSLASGCGEELPSLCGSSVYHKATFTSTISTTLDPIETTTTTTQDLFSATCFAGAVDDGTWECKPMTSCSNQAYATYMGKMSLTECMRGCAEDETCTSFLHECAGVCSMMVGLPCQGVIPLLNNVFRGGCGTLYEKAEASVTEVPDGCFEGLVPTPAYKCEPFMMCADTDNALNLGPLSLQACMDKCELYDCAAIQHSCGRECWLLTSCLELVPSMNYSCSTSVYRRDQLWPFWVATTTTTTVPGQCRPNAKIPLLDFSCQPNTYCVEQATARRAGVLSIERCAEACRSSSYLCQFFQYNCDNECLLLQSCLSYASRGSCHSSIYMKLPYSREASQHFYFDRTYAVAYSQSCYGSGCEVVAYCPFQFFALQCQLTTPSRSGGIYVPARNTNGFCIGYGVGPEIAVEAVCTSRFTTFGYNPESSNGSVSSVECPDDTTLMGCTCWTESQDADACGGTVSFEPKSSGTAPPRCELETAGAGARIGAICAAGQSQVRVQSSGMENKLHSFEEVQYCGWATTAVNGSEADCRGWMQDPSDVHVGGCKKTECLHLADCVKKCNSCGACAGVLHMDNGDPLFEDLNIACTMQTKDTEPTVSRISKISGRGQVLYVNSRNPACAPSHNIRRLTFFQDADCTRVVYPNYTQAGATRVQSSWSELHDPYVPPCSPYCATSDILFEASFLSPTAVQCAIVHSSLGFAKSWQMYTDRGLLGASTGPRVSIGRTAFDAASFQKGTIVMFEGPMVLWCQDRYVDCVQARNWAPTLSWRFSQMLGIPVHMLYLRTGMSRSQWADYRRLQDSERELQEGLVMGFRIYIKMVIDTPVLAELAWTVAADLKAMREQKELLGDLLNSFLPMTTVLGNFGDFIQTIQQPVLMAFPPPTLPPNTTTTMALAVTEDGDDAPTELLVVLGISAATLSGCATLLLVLYRRHRTRKEKEEARRVSSAGPSAVVVGGKATLRTHSRDLVLPLSEEALRYLPSYWTNGQRAAHLNYTLVPKDYLTFSQLLYVSHESLELFQDLLNFTYRAIPTQDRPCPKNLHEKTRGGCPCVRPGGDPGLPTGFQVKRVVRIENADKYSRYIFRRDEIIQNRDFCEAPEPPFFTSDAMTQLSGMSAILSNLNEDINEVYMWHGAPLRTALQIAREDFQLAFAGSGAGTMYGKALYFSESATKADEYAKDEPGGHYSGVRALLLCRICLGKYHYTLDREPAAEDKFKAGESDSTFGDRAKSVGTFREVALYDPQQVYPEYLILYERMHGTETPTPPSKDVPFLLELPLYWTNVAKNAYAEGFREHWLVKFGIKDIVQRLVNGSCSGKVPVVQSVKRIEDSSLWCRYINWKRNLSKTLQADNLTACVPPHELDKTSSGQVLTAKIEAEVDGHEAISVDNMAPGLNELLLWHGTSRKAAESIAEEGFMVTENHAHGRRFGPGIYLAEDLSKSMSYCKRYDGVLYVLLCRAVCGHLHYTEEDHDSNVGKEAKQLRKTCVLANPNQNGPREYILFDASQVYPEYIIELKI